MRNNILGTILRASHISGEMYEHVPTTVWFWLVITFAIPKSPILIIPTFVIKIF